METAKEPSAKKSILKDIIRELTNNGDPEQSLNVGGIALLILFTTTFIVLQFIHHPKQSFFLFGLLILVTTLLFAAQRLFMWLSR